MGGAPYKSAKGDGGPDRVGVGALSSVFTFRHPYHVYCDLMP